jgi:elongation factor P hydroxylase
MSQRLEQVFRDCFWADYRTVLVGGGVEPLYQPSSAAGRDHRIVYRENFFASALHEVAHWCIAGAQRREHVDYGYWYAPDGRDPGQQRQFEQVEVKPQALEWHLALACNSSFRISADNLQGQSGDGLAFAVAVAEQAQQYARVGLPVRAQRFRLALASAFAGSDQPDASCFTVGAPQ